MIDFVASSGLPLVGVKANWVITFAFPGDEPAGGERVLLGGRSVDAVGSRPVACRGVLRRRPARAHSPRPPEVAAAARRGAGA